MKLPKVETESNNKVFAIPELKKYKQNEKLEIHDAQILGNNAEAYLNSLIKDNADKNFYCFGKAIGIERIKELNLEELRTLSHDDVLVVNDYKTISELVNAEKREFTKIIESIDSKILIIKNESSKLSGSRLRTIKNSFIITSDYNDDKIKEICKPIPSAMKKIAINDNEGIEYINKGVKKIRYGK